MPISKKINLKPDEDEMKKVVSENEELKGGAKKNPINHLKLLKRVLKRVLKKALKKVQL